MGIRLLIGDCLEQMRELPSESVHSVVTDPPYGLSSTPDMAEVMRHWLKGDDYSHGSRGFMGKDWDSFVPGPATWKAAYNALKPGGYLLAFAGSRTYDLMCLSIRLAGFDIRDQIMWLYGSGFPKSHNLKGDWDGWGTALKPAHEPVVVARKPFKGSVAANVLAHGTGALNINGCRVESGGELLSGGSSAGERKTRMTGDHRQGAALGMFAPGAKRKGEWSNPAGRWPANVIHDGSDEVVGLFPETKAGGYPPEGGQRSQVSTYERPTTRGKQKFTSSEGSAARFFYCAKASKADREYGLETFQSAMVDDGREKAADNAYQRGKTLRRNTHPTVKPTDLMRYLCRLVTPPGGTVLDPFMGSGSTGKAAALEGFSFVGIELDQYYADLARARIDAVTDPEVQS